MLSALSSWPLLLLCPQSTRCETPAESGKAVRWGCGAIYGVGRAKCGVGGKYINGMSQAVCVYRIVCRWCKRETSGIR